MTKLINMKGVVALAMALSFCVYSVTPTLDNSTIVSKPITSYEAQAIKGGVVVVIPLAWVGYALAADAAIIVGAFALYGVLEVANQLQGGSSSAED